MSYWKKLTGSILTAVVASHAMGADNASTVPVEPQLAKFAEGMRSNYRSMIPTAGTPDPVARVEMLEIPAINPDRKVRARLYVPQESARKTLLPVVLFVHGGGFVSGDLETHDVLARTIANRAKALVLSIDYRLAPENPFPAGVDDVYATLQWVAANAGKIGGNPNRIAVSGDSAGANIATVVSILARDRRGPKIAAQWLMYPTVSNKMDTASWAEYGKTNFPTREVNTNCIAAYVPKGTSPYAPLVAPLWADHKGLPPALVQVGELDPLRDENVEYAKALKAAGVDANAIVYPGQHHGFMQFYKDKEHNSAGDAAIETGIEFLKRVLPSS